MKYIILLAGILLIFGCSAETRLPSSAAGQGNYMTFTIGEGTPISPIKALQKATHLRREANKAEREVNEQIDSCIDKITKNWVRTIDGKMIRGYDKELDFEMRWELREALLNNEKAC